jgi:hypothetical protein
MLRASRNGNVKTFTTSVRSHAVCAARDDNCPLLPAASIRPHILNVAKESRCCLPEILLDCM